jgi:predicted GNAT family acetyltransferase
MNLQLLDLYSLMGEAVAIYFRAAPNRDIRLTPHACLAATGEPYTDLNIVLIDQSSEAEEQLRAFHQLLQARDLPALYMLTPSVADRLAATAQALGMTFAGKAPVMVCEAAQLRTTTSDEYSIKLVETADELAAVCSILAHAFKLNHDALQRVLGIAALDGPGLTMYLAYHGEQPVSTVATTVAGPIVGVWSMGTLPDQQRKGAGRALLTQVMAQHRAQGARYFYLWSTPAGQRLYDQLGYRTVAEFAVWTTGQSVQIHA